MASKNNCCIANLHFFIKENWYKYYMILVLEVEVRYRNLTLLLSKIIGYLCNIKIVELNIDRIFNWRSLGPFAQDNFIYTKNCTKYLRINAFLNLLHQNKYLYLPIRELQNCTEQLKTGHKFLRNIWYI